MAACSDSSDTTDGEQSACDRVRAQAEDLSVEVGASASDDNPDGAFAALAEGASLVIDNPSCFTSRELQEAEAVLRNLE